MSTVHVKREKQNGDKQKGKRCNMGPKFVQVFAYSDNHYM